MVLFGNTFGDFGNDNFPFLNSFQEPLQNRRFSSLASRSGFGAANRCSCVLPFYCVSQLSVCRSQWNGCVEVHRCGSCMRNTFVFWS